MSNTSPLRWQPKALAEYQYWLKHDRTKAERIDTLIASIKNDGPFTGLGKPEPLKWKFQGCWSRRIDSHHRLVYEVSGTDGSSICIRSCGTHYDES